MSSQEWKAVYWTIRMANRSLPPPKRIPRYPDTLIVAMYFWSVAHDRPLCWAAQRCNYSSLFRPRRLPSRSQFCRRIAGRRCAALIKIVNRRMRGAENPEALCFIDGRALGVGPCSQDGDARSGPIPGGFGKGYKLHALVQETGRFRRFRIERLNVSEKTTAHRLIRGTAIRGWVLADGAYDSGKMYDEVDRAGGWFLTPLPQNAGKGHRVQSKPRLLAADLWQNGVEAFYQKRNNIERIFSRLSSFGGGLAPLPPWVRGLPRVRRWVTAKIILYHARLEGQKEVA